MNHCTRCGKEISDETTLCQECGQREVALQDSLNTSDASDHITRDEYSLFIGKNADYYLPRFDKFDIEGKERFRVTWHWPAFFATFFWLLYRKLYGWAVLSIIITFASPLIFSAVILRALPDSWPRAFPDILAVLWLILGGIFWPVTANYMYFKHAKKKLVGLKRNSLVPETRSPTIAAAGSVNRIAVAVVITVLILAFGALNVTAWLGMQDFNVKSRMHESINAMGAIRTAMIAYVAESQDAKCPDCSSAKEVESKLGFTVPERYVKAIGIKDCTITATLHNINEDVNGKTLTLAPSRPDLLEWTWGGTVPAKYRPK